MIEQGISLAVWLLDVYAAASIVLIAALAASAVVRQPVQRMAIAWASLVSLALISLALCLPDWPRISLLARLPGESAEVSERVPDAAADVGEPTSQSQSATPIAVIRSPGNESPKAAGEGMNIASAALRSNEDLLPEVPGPSAVAIRREGVLSTISMLWLIGAGGVALWLGWGGYCALRLRRRTVAGPEFVHTELERLVGRGGRMPRLLVSRDLQIAVACGVRRPTILLPENALDESARAGLPALLAHEYAHITRRDLWLLSLGRLLLVVLYAHPLYWVLRRRIAADQEHVADACAAGVCGHARYAEQLVAWARRLDGSVPRLNWGLGMDARPGQLSRRIAMLLDDSRVLERSCSRGWTFGVGAAGALVVIVLSLVTLRPDQAVRAEEAATEESSSDDAASRSGAERPSAENVGNSPDDDPNALASPADIERIVKRLEIFTTIKVDESQVHKLTRADLARWERTCDRILFEGKTAISGICRDEHGAPIAGARWRLFRLDYREKQQTQIRDVTTDAAGRFQFLPVDGPLLKRQPTRGYSTWWGAPTLYLVGQAPGRGTILWHVFAGEPNDKLEFTMRPAATLTGTVVDDNGRPITGATVTATRQGLIKSLPGVRSATTDQFGRYSITDLESWRAGDTQQPPDDEGRLVQRTTDYAGVDHPDYAPRGFEYSGVPGTFDVTLARPATIAGRVLIDGTNEPAVNATVELRNDNSTQSTTTDDEGRFKYTRVAPATLQILARLSGKPTTVRSGIEVRSGDNEVDLRIAPGGKIHGRVTELATGRPPLQQPLEQFTIVMLSNEQGAILETAAVEADGSFTIPAPAGAGLISVCEFGAPNVEPYRAILLDNGQRSVTKRVEVAVDETVDVQLRLMAVGEGDEVFDPSEADVSADEGNATNTPGQVLSEQAAAAAISKLGGWTKTEAIDGAERVVEVNMIYHETEDGNRLENKIYSDEALDYVRKFPYLKLLALTRGQANDKALANLRGLEHLEMFVIYEAWNISDDAVEHLTSLPAIKTVDLVDAQQLTDVAVAKLARIDRLENIGVTGGSLSDDSLKHIAKLRNLQSIQLGSSVATFTDDGLKNLAGLDKLELVAIEGRHITDAGLQHLRGLKKLKHLMVAGTAITEAGAAKLQEVLPELKVSGGRKSAVPAVSRD